MISQLHNTAETSPNKSCLHHPNNNNNNNHNLDWNAVPDAVESVLNDGHIPETLQNNNNKQQQQQQQQQQPSQTLRIYPEYHLNRPSQVHVVDDAVEPDLVHALYEYTIEYCGGGDNKTAPPAWGSYVTAQQVLNFWQETKNPKASMSTTTTSRSSSSTGSVGGPAAAAELLSLQVAASFFRNALNVDTCHVWKSKKQKQQQQQQQQQDDDDNNNNISPQQQPSCKPFWSMEDMNQIHGIALWALASDVGSSVPYHIDYAELIRYEHGVLVPPVLAGTLQCTPAATLTGGEYCVTTDGLEHYQQYGYKGALKQQQQQQQIQKQQSTTTTATNNRKPSQTEDPPYYGGTNAVIDPEEIMKGDDSWIRIPFQCNRMICQSGHLPHLSTPLVSLIPNATPATTAESNHNDNNKQPLRRVIVGFNVFLKDIGPAIQLAPEHSPEFRKRVADLRKQRQQQQQKQQQQQQQKQRTFSLSNIKANPRLASLLVQAKREKVKMDLKRAQEELDQKIQQYLLSMSSTTTSPVQQDIVDRFARHDGEWPNPIDVQVHLQHRFNHLFEASNENTITNN